MIMSAGEKPFSERLMQDGKGAMREEFLEYMNDLREESEEKCKDFVKILRNITESFLAEFDKEKIRRTLGTMDSVDLLDEIDLLHAQVVIMPRNDSELYDCHVNTIRLVELVKVMIITNEAEEELKRRILLNRLDWHKFVF